jgi:hypothetical protein
VGGVLDARWFLSVGLAGPSSQGAREMLQVKWHLWRFHLMRMDG